VVFLFVHSWEQRKFEDLYNYASEGGTPDTNNSSFYENGDVPFVKIEDTENKYIDSTKSYITQEGLSHSSAWLIPESSVIFTNGATVGNVAINRLPVATKQGILGIIPSKNVLTEFLFYLLSSATFQREVRSRMATGTFATIILKNLNQIPVCIPSDKSEQEEIAGYLSAFDNLITLHQRECLPKTCSLASWFYQQTNRKMTSFWEQRKLGDIGKARSGVGFPDADQGGVTGVPFFKVSDMNLDGNENEMIVANNYVTAEQIADHRWSPITELPAIFFAKVGAAVMLNRKRLCRFPFLLDNNTMAYSLSPTKWDADFAKALFGTVDLTSLVQVGALPSYNAGDVESMEIYLPSLFEQEQIGAFFKQLDNLITLHQCKDFSLKSVFEESKNFISALRKNTSWEQRKAKELCNIGTGKSNTQDQVEDGTYPFYIRSDIPVKSNKYLYDCEAVITIGDGNIGRVFHYVNGKFDLHQRCYKMTDFQDIWGKYFYYFFSTRFYDRAMKMTAKATVDSVRLEMISEMDILKPMQIAEQREIAEFFTNLDNLITLHQRIKINITGDYHDKKDK
jgi:type I restriction enzyme S subunit